MSNWISLVSLWNDGEKNGAAAWGLTLKPLASTWRIIPLSKCLGSPLFISHEKAIYKGNNPILRGLTITMGKLTIYVRPGMILQVVGGFGLLKTQALEASWLQICISPVVCLKMTCLEGIQWQISRISRSWLFYACFLIKKKRRLKTQRFPVMANSCGDIPTKSEWKRVAGW